MVRRPRLSARAARNGSGKLAISSVRWTMPCRAEDAVAGFGQVGRGASLGRLKSREPVVRVTLDALAAEHRLSGYGACCLELGLRRRLPLATRDAELLAAMQRCGVPLAALD